jgi:hypothetical protein
VNPRVPLRLVKPKPIDTKRAQKASRSDPAMRARLANAYLQAGGNDEKAARILRVTVGSARLAKRRHLDASERDHRQKPPDAPQGTRQLGASPVRPLIVSVTRR